METRIDGKVLTQGLARVARAIPSRAGRPILQNVLVHVDGTVRLSGTDMEVGISVDLDGGDRLAAGEALLPCKRLQGIAKGLGKQSITLAALDGCKVSVAGNGTRYQLVGDDPSDYPTVPTFPSAGGFQIAGAPLAEAIRQVSFAAASEESRYAIHGILLHAKSGSLYVVATDGKRLAYTVAAEHLDCDDFTALVPPRALDILRKEIGKADPTVHVALDGKEGDKPYRRIFFQVGGATIMARLIEGTFPSWEEVTPKTFRGVATMDTKALADCIRQASLIAAEGAEAIEMRLSPDMLIVKATVANVGEAAAEIRAQVDGEPVNVHMNPRYILDLLKVAPKTVSFSWNDARSAVQFGAGALAYVVMPITLEASA